MWIFFDPKLIQTIERPFPTVTSKFHLASTSSQQKNKHENGSETCTEPNPMNASRKCALKW